MSDVSELREVLTPQFLSRTYSRIAAATLSNPMLDLYSRPTEYDGDEIDMVVFDDIREPAPVNPRGAPARTLDAAGAARRRFVPIHVFNEVTVPMAAVEFLRRPESRAVQDRGLQELRRQMDLFGRRHRSLRGVVLAQALTRGRIHWDRESGRILDAAGPGAETVELGVPDSHRETLAHPAFAGSDIIEQSWSDPAAKILTQLENIREAAEFDKAPIPRHVWLHPQAKRWLRANTEIGGFLRSSPTRSEEALAGFGDAIEIADFVFHFFGGTWEGPDGNLRPLIPKDTAAITPDPGDWFRHYETSETVPLADGVIGSFDSIFSSTTRVYGDFAYLRIADNPVKVTMRMGMNFLYAFADPAAVWCPLIQLP
jgi:hypothetical protein